MYDRTDLIDYNITYSFCPVELLFCFMECPCILAVFSLQDFLFVSTNCNQFLHHGDVGLDLVVHERDLFILFLGFAN